MVRSLPPPLGGRQVQRSPRLPSSATITLWAVFAGAGPPKTSLRPRLLIPLRGTLMHPRFAFVVLTGLVLLLAVVRPAGAEEKPSEPVVPAAVRVPPGHKLLARAEAKGVQIYKSVAGTDRTLAW